MQGSGVKQGCRVDCSLGASKVYTLQAMPHETEDPRSILIELAKEGRFSWELIAREFIMANSKDDVQDVLDTLTDNY